VPFDSKSDSKICKGRFELASGLNEACQKLQPRQTNSVDWFGIGLIAMSLAVATVGIVVVARVGIKIGRGRNRPTRIRKAEGEFEPPEPPEGRYWG
jgi:hypothetical protein